MTVLDFGLLVVAGFFAGLIGFVTGLASLVSYPALLAVGLPAVSANVTNTVALVAAGVGATASSSAELAKDGKQLVRYAIYSALGGTTGAILLLNTPDGSFEVVVPFLVAMAAVALLLQPSIRKLSGGKQFPTLYPLALFAVAIYGGYFGAGAGVIFLALALICTSDTFWRASVLKSFFLGIANLIAAIIFSFSGQVHWLAALALAIGCFVGGACGPPTVKVISPIILRIGVGILGLGLAGWLGYQAFG
ncbi:sulfite exporter TauE/SafE family protein [Rhodococcoides fascians A25f]|uniref:sulfite exporter TauE/SafE family protein n=1 Tax=Rhodococcoides fascians TaxID=1828 RepID=UPI00055B5E6E|nr:sulfite exporter TauE/SafE family protein [Rhodococcus fascians]QII08281.1 sulfite exporter TauE/SafE family protein [Rhodococcus fascians A25f]